MDFSKIVKLTFEGLKPTLESHGGLTVYASERSQFEGWLKVELCRVLAEHGLEPEPDKDRVDVAAGEWGIGVRTVSTNMHHDKVKNVKRSITKNVEALIRDIWKLANPGRTTSLSKRALLFIVFPVTHDDERWQSVYLKQLSTELTLLEHMQFRFEGEVPGVVYFGLCSDV